VASKWRARRIIKASCVHAVGGAVPDRFNLFRAHALRSVGGESKHGQQRPPLS
jgi:hypothetical protein